MKIKMLKILVPAVVFVAVLTGCSLPNKTSEDVDSQPSVSVKNSDGSGFGVSELAEGKFKVVDVQIKAQAVGPNGWTNEQVVACAFLYDSASKLSSFTSRRSSLVINYLDSDEESYMEVKAGQVTLFINKEMVKNILN